MGPYKLNNRAQIDKEMNEWRDILNRKNIERLYVFFACASLFFHVLNDVEVISGIKVFQLFAVVAAILSIYVSWNNKSYIKIYLTILIVATFLSSLFSLYDQAITQAVTLLILVMGTYSLSHINMKKVLTILNFFIPFALLILLIKAVKFPIYRFQGFYNDPNYLCTTLLVFTYFLVVSIKVYVKIIWKVLFVVELLVILFLVSLTLSRTGLFCIGFLLFTQVFQVLRKHPYCTVLAICVLISICMRYFSDYFSEQSMLLYERVFERGDNLSAAGELRGELSKQGIEHIMTNPSYMILGIGLGASMHKESIPKRVNFNRDHNTLTSCFTEQGIVSLIFFLLFLSYVTYSLFYKQKINKGLKIITFLSIMLFSMSIWQMSYLPFWFLLFNVMNDNI